MTNTTEQYNGCANWDSWEAYNMLTSFEDIFQEAVSDLSHDNLEACLFKALERANCDVEYIMFHRVDWREVAERLGGEKQAPNTDNLVPVFMFRIGRFKFIGYSGLKVRDQIIVKVFDSKYSALPEFFLSGDTSDGAPNSYPNIPSAAFSICQWLDCESTSGGKLE